MTLEKAVKKYLEAWNHCQVMHATYRLQGWKGDVRNMPPNLREAYDKVDSYLSNLHMTVGMGPVPDHVAIAQTKFPKKNPEA